LAETEAVLLICEELKYLQISEDLFARIEELAKMINSLITAIRKKSENL